MEIGKRTGAGHGNKLSSNPFNQGHQTATGGESLFSQNIMGKINRRQYSILIGWFSTAYQCHYISRVV